jgi:FkbM family methyltransferase
MGDSRDEFGRLVYTMKTMSELANLRSFFGSHPLTSNAPLRAWVRFISWQVRSRFQGEIVFDWVGGQRLAIRHGMTGATQNIYVGLYEFADMMLPLHFLHEGDLFLDIGANVGTYTVLASGVCRARTLAFEPDPNSAQHLKRNVEINKLETLVSVYECALGPEQGEVAFTVGLDTVNRIASADDKNIRMTRLERLDAIIVDSQPIMMKVDVEGAEEGVLYGAETLLANPCLKVIELETVTLSSADILTQNHFERAYYNPFSHELTRNPISLKSSNALFVRDWSFVGSRLASAKKVAIFDREI